MMRHNIKGRGGLRAEGGLQLVVHHMRGLADGQDGGAGKLDPLRDRRAVAAEMADLDRDLRLRAGVPRQRLDSGGVEAGDTGGDRQRDAGGG
jgi:hypothetical protein